ncbi:MAG: HNH endonuclease [Phycisphaerales bacterium]|jgi:hypothetical protein
MGTAFFNPRPKQFLVVSRWYLVIRNLAKYYSLFTKYCDGELTIKLNFSVTIPSCLERPFILLALLYRRLRYGYTFRRIPLTHGQYAIVDPDDYERIAKYKWYAGRHNSTFYAIRGKWYKKRKKQMTTMMHRVIMNTPEGMFVDHINHNGLDNRKANLRLATRAENNRNVRCLKKNNSSKYRGVWHDKRYNKWRAQISINRKKKHLGYFKDEKEAGMAYDKAAKKYYGEFAILNFDPNKLCTFFLFFLPFLTFSAIIS